jgi:methylthioribose-1-phosphate isomerase
MIPVKTIEWIGGAEGFARLIDQTLLPTQVDYVDARDVGTIWDAIRMLRVRGAPAIGVAAAYGMYLAVRDTVAQCHADFLAAVDEAKRYLDSSRPTAVNLFWATARIRLLVARGEGVSVEDLKTAMLAEAQAVQREDAAMCRALGDLGAALIKDGDSWLTHCNAGALATAGLGTATAAFYVAHEQGKHIHVFADETRPLLQGSRLTAWELHHAGIPVTVITDSMAATVMAQGKVQGVIVGTDRLCANGDFANKIGTLGLAILANEFGVPFYVSAPSSSIDLSLLNGDTMPIEERNAEEISMGLGRRTAPEGVAVYNPAFDVTPHRYITAIITERGVLQPPFEKALKDLLDPSPNPVAA